MQWESAAHQRSGKPGSTLPVGYGSTSKLGPTVRGWAPPWTVRRSGFT